MCSPGALPGGDCVSRAGWHCSAPPPSPRLTVQPLITLAPTMVAESDGEEEEVGENDCYLSDMTMQGDLQEL